MPSKDEAFEPFLNLKKRLAEAADSLGLTVERYMIIPDPDGQMHMIQAVLSVRSEALMSEADKEQAKMDAQFEAIAREMQEKELLEEKLPDIKKDLGEWFGKE